MYVEILLMRMLFCWFCKASLEIPKLKYKLLSNYFSCIKFGVLKLFTFPIFYSFFFVTGKQNGLKLFLLGVCLFEWMSSIRNRIGLFFCILFLCPEGAFHLNQISPLQWSFVGNLGAQLQIYLHSQILLLRIFGPS